METSTKNHNSLGYPKNISILPISKKMYAFSQELADINEHKTPVRVNRMQLTDALFDSKIFLNRYFKLHKVPYLAHIIKIGSKEIYPVKMIDPYNLPIVLNETDVITDGYIAKTFTNNKFHRVAFRDIHLSECTTELTSGTYCHEITHSQLEALPGSIRHSYNAEVLSIFMELFHAYVLGDDEKILSFHDAKLSNEINVLTANLYEASSDAIASDYFEFLEDGKYIASSVKALQLFSIFYYGSKSVKLAIIRDIQKVFDGQICVEELLTKYEVTYKKPDYPQILKYLKR